MKFSKAEIFKIDLILQGFLLYLYSKKQDKGYFTLKDFNINTLQIKLLAEYLNITPTKKTIFNYLIALFEDIFAVGNKFYTKTNDNEIDFEIKNKYLESAVITTETKHIYLITKPYKQISKKILDTSFLLPFTIYTNDLIIGSEVSYIKNKEIEDNLNKTNILCYTRKKLKTALKIDTIKNCFYYYKEMYQIDIWSELAKLLVESSSASNETANKLIGAWVNTYGEESVRQVYWNLKGRKTKVFNVTNYMVGSLQKKKKEKELEERLSKTRSNNLMVSL